jgi:hypothetical protein
LGPLWFACAQPLIDGRRPTSSLAMGGGNLHCALYLLRPSDDAGRTAKRINAGGFGLLGMALVLQC